MDWNLYKQDISTSSNYTQQSSHLSNNECKIFTGKRTSKLPPLLERVQPKIDSWWKPRKYKGCLDYKHEVYRKLNTFDILQARLSGDPSDLQKLKQFQKSLVGGGDTADSSTSRRHTFPTKQSQEFPIHHFVLPDINGRKVEGECPKGSVDNFVGSLCLPNVENKKNCDQLGKRDTVLKEIQTLNTTSSQHGTHHKSSQKPRPCVKSTIHLETCHRMQSKSKASVKPSTGHPRDWGPRTHGYTIPGGQFPQVKRHDCLHAKPSKYILNPHRSLSPRFINKRKEIKPQKFNLSPKIDNDSKDEPLKRTPPKILRKPPGAGGGAAGGSGGCGKILIVAQGSTEMIKKSADKKDTACGVLGKAGSNNPRDNSPSMESLGSVISISESRRSVDGLSLVANKRQPIHSRASEKMFSRESCTGIRKQRNDRSSCSQSESIEIVADPSFKLSVNRRFNDIVRRPFHENVQDQCTLSNLNSSNEAQHTNQQQASLKENGENTTTNLRSFFSSICKDTNLDPAILEKIQVNYSDILSARSHDSSSSTSDRYKGRLNHSFGQNYKGVFNAKHSDRAHGFSRCHETKINRRAIAGTGTSERNEKPKTETRKYVAKITNFSDGTETNGRGINRTDDKKEFQTKSERLVNREVVEVAVPIGKFINQENLKTTNSFSDGFEKDTNRPICPNNQQNLQESMSPSQFVGTSDVTDMGNDLRRGSHETKCEELSGFNDAYNTVSAVMNINEPSEGHPGRLGGVGRFEDVSEADENDKLNHKDNWYHDYHNFSSFDEAGNRISSDVRDNVQIPGEENIQSSKCLSADEYTESTVQQEHVEEEFMETNYDKTSCYSDQGITCPCVLPEEVSSDLNTTQEHIEEKSNPSSESDEDHSSCTSETHETESLHHAEETQNEIIPEAVHASTSSDNFEIEMEMEKTALSESGIEDGTLKEISNETEESFNNDNVRANSRFYTKNQANAHGGSKSEVIYLIKSRPPANRVSDAEDVKVTNKVNIVRLDNVEEASGENLNHESNPVYIARQRHQQRILNDKLDFLANIEHNKQGCEREIVELDEKINYLTETREHWLVEAESWNQTFLKMQAELAELKEIYTSDEEADEFEEEDETRDDNFDDVCSQEGEGRSSAEDQDVADVAMETDNKMECSGYASSEVMIDESSSTEIDLVNIKKIAANLKAILSARKNNG